MGGEFVFSVDGSAATPAKPITLAEAGVKERDHLQEWVISHPEILGPDVLIITSEFDKWESKHKLERHRPDVIGLDSDGRLVVVELKRDAASETVHMQAINYAATTSRFDVSKLAEAHRDFLAKSGGGELTKEQAEEKILGHAELLAETEETLRKPRIILLAGTFPSSVTSTVVWLTEMELSITLLTVQAYQTAHDTVVTISQLWPLAQEADFVVGPARQIRNPGQSVKMPEVVWSLEDLEELRVVDNVTVKTTMDLCSADPGSWVPASAVQQTTGRDPAVHKGDYGGFGITLKHRFHRSNWPFERKWRAGPTNEMYYSIAPNIAAMWLEGAPPSDGGGLPITGADTPLTTPGP
jgi:hypothetical protein